MDEQKEGALIKWLRDATTFEVGLVAFLFLPPVLLAWLTILGAVTDDKTWKLRIFLALAIVYALMVGIMTYGRVKSERRKKNEEERQRKIELERKSAYERLFEHHSTILLMYGAIYTGLNLSLG